MGKVVKTFKNQTRQAHRESSPAGIYFFFLSRKEGKKTFLNHGVKKFIFLKV